MNFSLIFFLLFKSFSSHKKRIFKTKNCFSINMDLNNEDDDIDIQSTE